MSSGNPFKYFYITSPNCTPISRISAGCEFKYGFLLRQHADRVIGCAISARDVLLYYVLRYYFTHCLLLGSYAVHLYFLEIVAAAADSERLKA